MRAAQRAFIAWAALGWAHQLCPPLQWWHVIFDGTRWCCCERSHRWLAALEEQERLAGEVAGEP